MIVIVIVQATALIVIVIVIVQAGCSTTAAAVTDGSWQALNYIVRIAAHAMNITLGLQLDSQGVEMHLCSGAIRAGDDDTCFPYFWLEEWTITSYGKSAVLQKAFQKASKCQHKIMPDSIRLMLNVCCWDPSVLPIRFMHRHLTNLGDLSK